MCGICCIFCKETTSKITLNETFDQFKENIAKRGPDSFEIEHFSSKTNHNLLFAASVLWLQGKNSMRQPLTNDRSVFVYNGDIFEGLKDSKSTESDTTALFESFNETENIFSQLIRLQGPYAFVYFDKNKEQLYFGRDPFGRKSLLLGKTDSLIVLSSVGRKTHNCEFIELPSIGLFCWDLATNTLSLSVFQYTSPNFQSKLAEVKAFLGKEIMIRDRENINKLLEFKEPSQQYNCLYEALETIDVETGFSVILNNSNWFNKVTKLKTLLEKSIHRRISTLPKHCRDCIKEQLNCNHSLVGVLFSGGIDCSILALLADQFIDKSHPIDLLNVAFDEAKNYQTPDRQTGLDTLEELRRLRPQREWRFFNLNIPRKELDEARQQCIADLIHPLKSVLDDSLGCALWFAARGSRGTETSPCRVLLVGMGADELFGGYTKHRAAFKRESWLGLHNILREDWQNLPYRNLARDDRVVSDHGRQLRMPYLDEDLVGFVQNLQCWEKSCPSDKIQQGFGDKILLRSLAYHLGLTKAAILRKRALQFGSRIANKHENAHETSIKLC